MPTLSRFAGLWFVINMLDNHQHNTPHIHVYAGKPPSAPSLSISLDGDILAISSDFPHKKFGIIADWMILHEEELLVAWNKASKGDSNIEKIEPLR